MKKTIFILFLSVFSFAKAQDVRLAFDYFRKGDVDSTVYINLLDYTDYLCHNKLSVFTKGGLITKWYKMSPIAGDRVSVTGLLSLRLLATNLEDYLEHIKDKDGLKVWNDYSSTLTPIPLTYEEQEAIDAILLARHPVAQRREEQIRKLAGIRRELNGQI